MTLRALQAALFSEAVDAMDSILASERAAVRRWQTLRMRCSFADRVRELQGLPKKPASVTVWRPMPFVSNAQESNP
jgi:hypothetical protein